MKTKGRIKPSKPAAFGQMLGCGVFAIIGLTVIIPMIEKEGGPMWIGVLWTFGTAIGAVFGAYNFFSEEGIATEEFSYTSETPKSEPSIESRLRKLDELKSKKLINDHEYESKRSELLNQL
ncbi:SHOCT domain-containing protein [Coraliomargarita sp. SDUM461004]|uniref:SHOCT domain-containing protein n=1 Tax=Thalassobacterium sedimentorum TaxID=3041258 RepID=A0ABU1ANV8_9BACT|nr:SHOCT domain-containing protein [Coraliomargarita sp. SDUM461004]MDQ8196466.1 SHOCT domain-containing protein [Coraliomargarita sp. SDUM461004]